MVEWWKENWPVFVIAAIFLAPVGGVLTLAHLAGKYECYSKTESFESRHGLWYKCQIKVDGKWINYDNYRVVKEDRDE